MLHLHTAGFGAKTLVVCSLCLTVNECLRACFHGTTNGGSFEVDYVPWINLLLRCVTVIMCILFFVGPLFPRAPMFMSICEIAVPMVTCYF